MSDVTDWDPDAAERRDWDERIGRWKQRLDAAADRNAELVRAMVELAAAKPDEPEVFHPEADALLLAFVPAEAREAFLSRRRWYS